MQKLAIALALLYFAMAGLQYNDPDPLRWMVMYGTAAVLCLASAFKAVPPASLYVVALFAGVWAATLIGNITDVAAYTATELEREFGGLVVVTVGLVVLARRKSASAPVDSAA